MSLSAEQQASRLAAGYGMSFRSAQNGLGLGFRKLWPSERGRLAQHLLRLGADDRRLRFCAGISDEAIRAYGARFDWRQGAVFGCFADGELRGVAELVRQAAGAATAEVALSVEGPFQNRGIGSELLRLALLGARNRFIAKVRLFCLEENVRTRHIARKAGAGIAIRWGEAEATIERPWPNRQSWLEEASLEGGALLRAARLAAAATWSRP